MARWLAVLSSFAVASCLSTSKPDVPMPAPAPLPDSAYQCPVTKKRPPPPPKPRTLDQVVAWATATADVADYNERVGTECRAKLRELRP